MGHSIAKKHSRNGKEIQGLRWREDWETEEDTSVTTEEKCHSSLINKNENSSTELEKESQPSPPAQDKELKVVTEPSQVVTAVTVDTEDLKYPKEPELDVKKDENGNITSF